MSNGQPSEGEVRRDSLDDFGVLLLNMGGPEKLENVEEYLRELMSDAQMIQLPLGRFYQDRLARFIASRRAPKVQERYRAIGGGSPLTAVTRRQAAALSRALNRPVSWGMRYARPRTDDAVAELLQLGARRLVVLPLYPQYSHCTTGSALADLERCRCSCPIAVVQEHYDDAGYIEALAEKLRPRLADWSGNGTERVLFVAHSLPLRYVRRGDPYTHQTRCTAQLVAAATGLRECDWLLAFCSRVGPVRWQGPSLGEALAQLQTEQVRHLIVMPLSFVAENLETLWDLDLVFRRECTAAGFLSYQRVPTLGDSSRYIETLARLARQAAARPESTHG